MKPGTVIRTFVADIKDPKTKLVVILGYHKEDKTVCISLINTTINYNVHRSAGSEMMQLPLLKNECGFLDHDSYLDCTVVRERPVDLVAERIKNRDDIIEGAINDGLLVHALRMAGASKTIKRKIKKKYGFS